jgi:MATE family multidrug resistance protein
MAPSGAPSPQHGLAPATIRAEFGALTRLAAPIVGANLLHMAVFAVDVVFVARLGTIELAAATIAVFLFNVLCWALIGLTSAAEPLIAAAIGRRVGAVRDSRRSFRAGLWLGALASGPIMIVMWNGAALFAALGQDPLVAERAGAFLRIAMWGVPFAVAAGLMRLTAAALGRAGWAFLVTALALGVAIVANWALVFGHLGLPALGLEGSALAGVLVSVAMCFAYASIFRLDRRLRRFRLWGRWWRPDWPRMDVVAKLGAPIALTWTFEGGLFGGAALLMGLIGPVEVAAHAVALNVAAVIYQIPFGIAQAATIRVGMAFGAVDHRWITRAGNTALCVGIGVMAVTALITWAVPQLFVAVYLDRDLPDTAAAEALAIRLLGVAAVFQLMDGAQAVAQGVLRGLQDTRVAMLVALGGYWVVGFGTAVLLGFRTPLGAVGIWWGLATGLAVVSVLLIWRWSARARLGLLPVAT